MRYNQEKKWFEIDFEVDLDTNLCVRFIPKKCPGGPGVCRSIEYSTHKDTILTESTCEYYIPSLPQDFLLEKKLYCKGSPSVRFVMEDS